MADPKGFVGYDGCGPGVNRRRGLMGREIDPSADTKWTFSLEMACFCEFEVVFFLNLDDKLH